MFSRTYAQALSAPRFWLAGWWCALAVVLTASLLPMPQVGLDVSHGDKGLHLIAHCLLAGYAWMLFRPGGARLVAMLGLIGFGLAIEGLQALLPWRSADAWDLVANISGTALGCVLAAKTCSRLLIGLDRWLFASAGRPTDSTAR